jgi:hypothetical protein
MLYSADMTPNKIFLKSHFVMALLLCLCIGAHLVAAPSIPTELTDDQFWKLSSDFSEPDGTFRSDNLLSNEISLQWVLPDLMSSAKVGRAYLGVGPEQNFTYIVALKPKIAFIVDIRRGNLDLQLMYKALFELSKDRAEFVSRLFSRPRPDGLNDKSTAREIFDAYARVQNSQELFDENFKAVKDQLLSKHSFPLSGNDLDGIEYVMRSFFQYGLGINYNSSSGGFGGGNRVTYADLMKATDEEGWPKGYLSAEENFAFMKQLETSNLIVPVVGNFAGPKAIRAVGKYLADNDMKVSAFYLSNVEQYLHQDGIWSSFCENASTLPVDETSTFIRSVRGGRYGQSLGLNSDLGNMFTDLKACAVIAR